MPFRILVMVVLAAFLAGCPPPSGIYHTVKEGQTLYRIGRTYGVDEQYLARLNGVSDPKRLAVGQKLFIPGAKREKTIPTQAIANPASSAKTSSPKPVSSSPARAKQSVSPISAPVPSGSHDSYRGKFAWPLQGKILKNFISKTTPTKGIEIAARRGTPVLSAAAGKVIYSDNGISGYGNLIILKHEDSLLRFMGSMRKISWK